MAIINPALPTIGGNRGDGEQAVRNGLSSLLAEFNGNIESANIKDASILASDLADGVAATDAELQRAIFMGQVQAGVYGATHGMVTQRGAGANNTVDVAAGYALIPAAGTDLLVAVAIQATSVTIAPNPAGNPLVGSIFVGLDGIPVYSAGSAQAGATLDNAAGTTSRSALGATQIRLAELVVPAGYTTAAVSNTSIRDRRPFARGFFRRVLIGAQTMAFASPTYGVVTGTSIRVEASGAPIRVTLSGRLDSGATWVKVNAYIDGADAGLSENLHSFAASLQGGPLYEGVLVPTAGSHLIDLRTSHGGGTTSSTLTANAPYTVEELVRQNVANNSVTSG